MPLHLIVNLTKEEWQDAEIYGLVFRTDEETEFNTDPSKLPDKGVNLYLDVPLCFENLPFTKVRMTFISWKNTGHSYLFAFSCLPKRLIQE